METKKEKIVSAVATIGIVLTLFGATYAYFTTREDAGKTTGVEITANTVDVFSFETGDSISISLDQDSFAEGKGDKSGTTYAKATLTPNNKTNTATDYYYVYLNISDNTFSYSLGNDKPEILLQVTDADGATVTSLDGLTYSTVTNGAGEQVSGFDITTKTGLITLTNNREITANTNTKEELWNIRVVFVNYNENQADNAGNSFRANILIQKDVIPQIVGDVCKENDNLASCVIKLYNEDSFELSNLYYHDSNLTNGARDKSFRYAGASDSVNNFVCFGSNEETCLDDNLYRIIGVFGDQVKLIKWDYATSTLLGTDGDYSMAYSKSGWGGKNFFGTNKISDIGAYYWNLANASATYSATNYLNVWSYSKLNTVNLNTNFLNNIGAEWANKIAETSWKVGGNLYLFESNAQTAYRNEIINPNTTIESTYSAKIGLMYVSDYGFATVPSRWQTRLNNLGYRNDNWMYMGLYEWTITRDANYKNCCNTVSGTGIVNYGGVESAEFAVRPVFYLNSDVTYVSGFGTKSSPIRIN